MCTAVLLALPGLAAAADSTWTPGAGCVNITPSTWKLAACWAPAPPGEADTVVIPAGQSVFANTRTDATFNVEALVVGGLSVEKGAALQVVGGTFELKGATTVAGALTVLGSERDVTNASNTVNADALAVDPAARGLGLRDCAYTPIGFTPRLCGSGTVSVSGSLTLDGLYASIFAAVHVEKGGVYTVRNGGHPWGLVTNEGLVKDDAGYNIYWHGMIDNKAGGVVNFTQTTVFYDEYSHNGTDGGPPEVFTQPTFTNAGVFNIYTSLVSTGYTYAWGASGTYSPTLLNKKEGRVVADITTDYDKSIYLSNVTNHGYLKLGRNAIVASLVSDGQTENADACWTVYSFNNTGTFECEEPCTGAYSDPIPVLNNMKGGSVKVAGGYTYGSDDAEWTLNNEGHVEIDSLSRSSFTLVNGAGGVTWFSGRQSVVSSVANSGTMYVNGTTVWFNSQTCISCTYYLLNDGELHLQPSAQSRPHRGLIAGNTKAPKGTPKVCSGGACVSDPCPYAVEAGGSTCQTASGVPGVEYGLDSSKTCYACTAAPPLGLMSDEDVLERLAREARSRGPQESGMVPNAAELARRVFHFENAVLGGDGTGVLVSTSTVHLHGKKALQVRKGSMATILENWQPVVVGGGELLLNPRTTMHIGSEATLEDGGLITARRGSKVIVQAFSEVHARNHTLRMEPAAQLRIEGKLHLSQHSALQSCAKTVGRGTVVLDDPARAVKCEREAVQVGSCAAACTVDSDCSGECNTCGGGVCTEPACSFDGDCGFNGECVGGACVNCDSAAAGPGGRPPLGGPLCGSFKPTSYAQFQTLPVVPGGEAVTYKMPFWERNPGNQMEGVVTATVQGTADCGLGSSYDKIVTGYDTEQTNHPSPDLVLKSARNFQSVKAGGSQVGIFEYTYPNLDANCTWTNGVCGGTCSGGEKCAATGAAECGCPVKCGVKAPVPAGKCASYIAAGDYSGRGREDGIGDCTPGRLGCFCKRDGTQNLLKANGCPTWPAAVADPQSNDSVLLFYNTGSGDGIGLAKGPALGPWTVVKEPVLSGYQNPFVYTDGNVIHVLADKKGEANAPRHAASKDGGQTWHISSFPLLPLSAEVGYQNTVALSSRSSARVFPAYDKWDYYGWMVFSEVVVKGNETDGAKQLMETIETARAVY